MAHAVASTTTHFESQYSAQWSFTSTSAGSDLATVSTASLTAGQSVSQNATVTAPTAAAAANDITLASGALRVK
jgi:hypothetical protein